MRYKVGDKVEYQYGGYITVGTVVEVIQCGAYTNYAISGLKRQPVSVPDKNILGRF